MLLTTTETVDGKTISEYLGLVSAISIAVFPGGAKMMMRGLKAQMGDAKELLASEAEALGADAVIGIKYTAMGSNHVLIGTAVKIK